MKFTSARRIWLSVPFLVVLAQSVAQSQPAAPLQVERSIKLSFSTHRDVILPSLPTIKEPVALLHFDRSAQRAAPTPLPRSVVSGGLTWVIQSSDTRVIDPGSGATATTSALTSRSVRPDAIVHDGARGAIWLYGDALYRYQISTGELYRFRLASGPSGAIRKAVVRTAGVWLGTEGGALLFDAVAEAFRGVPQSNNARLVNATAAGPAVWLATEEPRLIKVTLAPSGRANITVSDKLPLGAPAEMYGIDDTVWLLLSSDHGGAYRVAYLAGDRGQLELVAGRYFSLREDGGRLLAGTQTKVLVIDPRSKTAASRAVDPGETPVGLSTAGVTFRGSSYSVKDPSEIVEQRPLDLSRGWSEPDLHATTAAAKR